MSHDLEKIFFAKAKQHAFNKEECENVAHNFSVYAAKHSHARSFYNNIGMIRDRAAYVRAKGINDLEKYLKDFEYHFTLRGGKIIWAFDEKEAMLAVFRILKEVDAQKIIATHSGALNEIKLQENLSGKYDLTQTAVQDYINHLSNEGDFELFRKNNKDLAQFFLDHFDRKHDSDPNRMMRFLRGAMRAHFLEPDVAITGANFLIADIGAISLCENEGNIARACAFPKKHIVVAGYDKIIPSINDIELFWTLFASSGNGTLQNAYNHIILGPRAEYESDGPNEMYLILLNNGRDEILKHYEQQKALHCIRCGACSRYCPIWRAVGGGAYGTPYVGPIGSVTMPLTKGSKNYRHLTYASTLTEIPARYCPVKIPLHELQLYNRALFVREKRTGTSLWHNFLMNNSSFFLKSRLMLNFRASQKNLFFSSIIKKKWGEERLMPKFAKKSFNEIYQINHPNDNEKDD